MPHTSLFVIDIQHELCGDPTTEIAHARRVQGAASTVLNKARQVISTARDAGRMPEIGVVIVQHHEGPDGTMVRGSKAWELTFPAEDGELVVEKDIPNTFQSKTSPNLAADLQAQGVRSIVACGIQSDACVRATCKGALAAGFDVTLLSGAHGTYASETKTAEEIEGDIEAELKWLGVKVVKWEEWEI